MILRNESLLSVSLIFLFKDFIAGYCFLNISCVKRLSVIKDISLNLYFLIISFIINILIIKSIFVFLSFLKLKISNSIKKGILFSVSATFLLSPSNNFFLYFS